MSRCIRKVENENFWIVYCNTTMYVFPEMHSSVEDAKEWIIEFEANCLKKREARK